MRPPLMWLVLILLLQIIPIVTQDASTISEHVHFEISEGLSPNAEVGSIPTRSGLVYALSEPSEEFQLDSSTGTIRTRVTLDREALEDDTIDLFVKSIPVAKHLIEVRISVLDVNDNRPVYNPPSIEVSFMETDNPGTQVVLDTASDQDIGSNGMTNNYEIISGNEEGKFRLVHLTDTSVRLMYLENRVTLDREERDLYQLNISARDGGNPPLYGYLQVNVTIKDYNDHPPLFDQSDYSAEINETASPGTYILKVTATDQDIGPNGQITYSIVSDDYNQFGIDPLTGEVSTLKPLSCFRSCDPSSLTCKQKSCLITVEARDNGRPFPLTGRAFVSVILVDVNDHDPVVNFKYTSLGPYATVEEGAKEGETVIALVSVTDLDEGVNGQTEATITKGNELGHFVLESSAVIPGFNLLKVAGKLDREKVSRYNITVQARDFGNPPRTSQNYLIIVVNDINDHQPVFQKVSYSKEFSEDLPLGSFVASVTATDNDTGINAAITYEITSGNDLGWFEIGSNTGLVITAKPLDREQTSRVQLTILARDGAVMSYSSSTTLSITITDVNDEAPTFSPSESSLSFPEGTRAGIALMTFTAMDRDEGKNGSVQYLLDPSVDLLYPAMFQVHPESGTLRNLQEFDRESFSDYTVRVIAVDEGELPLSSTATLFITVDDLNDNPPVFYPSSYYASVLEGIGTGVSVVQVTASDADDGNNAVILFSLSHNSNSFEIERETGWIKTTEALTSKKYTLAVSASDAGGLPAAESAIVEISVVREQEPAPIFSQPAGYSFSISEDNTAPVIGRSAGQVRASGQGQLLYSIINGDDNGDFVVGSINGQIKTAKGIDREIVQFYSLTVIASSDTYFSSVEVNITINDLNDNSPVFQLPAIATTVKENWPVGHDVHLASAVDPDAGSNGRLTYRLMPGSSSVFVIDEVTGMITVAQPLSQLTDSVVDLFVEAKDGGVPSLSSQQTVHIHIEDINDHTPAFDLKSYEVSVSEAEEVNSRFFDVTAVDSDIGLNGHVTYEIVGGNKERKFGIFPDGALYITQPLDREAVSLYVLTIRARDMGSPQRSSLTNVTISVLDNNDNDPKFSNNTFSFELVENSPRGTSVGTVYASDRDTGRNAEMSYHIDGESSGFAIDPRSGMLVATVPFDRESVISEFGSDVVKLSVVVEDGGEPRRQDRSAVDVRIKDLNDNPPVFAQSISQLTLYENTDVGSQIATVSANDADSGVNAELHYSILGGDGTFAIDPLLGQISLNKGVDRETHDSYRLTIMAMDNGEPPLSGTTIVSVSLLDFNDNRPEFVMYENASISEATEVGRELFTVKAIDEDLGLNGFVEYSIAGGNVGTAFHIDSNSGRLSLASPLDYEQQSLYILEIQAHDLGTPAMVSTVSCWVNIRDENDHAPLFSSSPIVGFVTEDAPVSTSVLLISAIDGDSGSNGNVLYTLKRQEPPGRAFEIDAQTGVITTAKSLDHEMAESYQLTIVAADQAYPSSARKSSEKIVTINVHDLNDNAPDFTSVTAVPVLIGSLANTLVTTVTAVDRDSGMNGRVNYEIYNGDTDMFRINSDTGDLYLRSNLNSQVLTYDLTIRARDNGPDRKSNFFQLTIFARSSDDNGPSFSQTSYSGQVYENVPAGTSIVAVSASYPMASTGSIEYYITSISSAGSPQPRMFQIQPTSGLISTSQELDRETGFDVFNLDVYAIDKSSNSPRTNKCTVQITLLDTNDSPPQFTSDLFELTMSEDSKQGDEVATLVARDADQTGSVTYSIREGSEKKFDIDPLRGVIRVIGSLDRESKPYFELIIVADDGNQRSEAKVIVEVTDVNDKTPEFTEPIYAFDIPENTRTGARLGQISATDLDEGSNAELTYSLITHWGRDKVSLHPHSGVVTLIGALDYEEVPLYILTVKVQDSGPISLSSTSTVLINVIDTNDNAPIFDPSTYSDQVWENATIGKQIMEVSATDVDSGMNGWVRYSITGGDIDHHFEVDQTTGIISVAKALDRETQGHYNLAIEARDQSADTRDQLSSTAVVTVILKDCNDHAPQFLSPGFFTVSEDSVIGASVYQVITSDLDEGQNGVVEFTLNDLSSFTIGKNDGVIRLNRDLDREMESSVEFVVIVNDKGTPAMTSSLTFTVAIDDANDNSPEVNPQTYSATVDEDIPIGSRLLEIYATDADVGLNADLRYTVISGDPNRDFLLDSHTGELSVQKRLDYERKTRYDLVVAVEDQGDPQLSDRAAVSINIEDVNDCIPLFVDSPFVAYVQENVIQLPLHVAQISARDDDTGAYGRVTYSIIEGERSLFKINSSNGEITALRTLDREEMDHYELTISAMDAGSPRLTGTGMISIRVGDDNDNKPRFEHDQYSAEVMENQAAMTTVVKVTATDRDTGKNADIKYSLQNDASGRFGIDQSSGEVFTLMSLNREERDVYNLVAVATDSGSLPLSSTVSIIVKVNDDNDNVPKFLLDEYNVQIRDPTRAGWFITGVTALDADAGESARIRYSLLGGTETFSIEEDTGVILAAEDLTSSEGGHQIYVRATDMGSRSLSNSVTVSVSFLPTSTTDFPVFTTTQSSFRLSESASVNHVVTTVAATSPRPQAVVSYFIAGGNTGDAFGILDDGRLIVRNALDYETTHSYHLWVEARDNSDPPLSAYHNLILDILDENDNAPVFSQHFFNTSVAEGEYGSLNVLQVTAVDADTGDNARVTYALEAGNEAGMFVIDKTSGGIRTQMRLDRETVDAYQLVVTATDHGNPRQTSTATVEVHVSDKNDHPPLFSQHFNVRLPESTPVGSFVLCITSTDADIGENAANSYAFISSTNGQFAIDSASGNITVATPLDRESKDEYILDVAANDGAYNSETSVSIFILDVNDNQPQFDMNRYSFSIVGGSPVGTSVGQVSATDADAPGPNSDVFYRFKQPTSLFTIHPGSGVVSSRKEVQFQLAGVSPSPENNQRLIVVVFDRGEPPMRSEVPLTISILPSNENTPLFYEKSYSMSIEENWQVGRVVGTVTASDADIGANAELTYSVTSGNGTDYFVIDAETGVISLSASVASKVNKKFQLTVAASDRGAAPRSSSTSVMVSVLEINRNAPRFTGSDQAYQTSMPESRLIGNTIGKVTATDNDSGPNGEISYAIANGNDLGLFVIDPIEGYISISKELDYEQTHSVQLNITASDHGSSVKTVWKVFIITITDENDNGPQFDEAIYRTSVEENSPRGTVVFVLTAHDADDPPNDLIKYSMTGDDQALTLLSLDGNILSVKTSAGLDYESLEELRVTIEAVNPGESIVGRAEIVVDLSGVNEYIPVFTQNEYTFTVSESASVGYTFGSVRASDLDSGQDGIVQYSLVGDSNLKGFSVDIDTGVLVISDAIDREATSEIVLDVAAKNHGPVTGDDLALCQVRVTISDANDPPQFTQSVYEGSIREDARVGTTVLKVSAVDNDLQNSFRSFRYSITTGNHGEMFSVNQGSGWVTTNARLDREKHGTYNLTVAAVDTGSPPQTGTSSIRIHLDDINDNGPFFIPSVPVGSIRENQPSLSADIIDLTQFANDPDLPPNRGPYRFTLINNTLEFTVDSTKGVVRARKSLDREAQGEYYVGVKVEDNGAQAMTSELTFKVEVTDENDNPSRERLLDIQAYVFEGRFPGGVIADVRPLDNDLEGSYSCSLRSTDGRAFSIPDGSCELHASSRQDMGSFELSIQGSDGVHSAVDYFASVDFERFEQATVDAAVVIRLASVQVEILVESFVQRFVDALRDQVTNNSDEQLMVFALSQVSSDVDLFMVVADGDRGFISKEMIRSRIAQGRLEMDTGLQVRSLDASACDSSPCLNGGSCASAVRLIEGERSIIEGTQRVFSTFPRVALLSACVCQQGFTGDACDEHVDACKTSPCLNLGTCTSTGAGTFSCQCAPQFKGERCESDVNECTESNPCVNSGVCQNTVGSYFCKCLSDYSGVNCEIAADTCGTGPCLNGGTCDRSSGSPRCSCKQGDRGVQCEIASKNFQKLSYMEYDMRLDRVSNDIEVEFATTKDNALLVFFEGDNAATDFLALEVVDGEASFTFSAGYAVPGRVVVPGRVNDGSWYRMEANRIGNVGKLKVTRCPEGSQECLQCMEGEERCYRRDQQLSDLRLLDNDRTHALLVGGLRNERDLQRLLTSSQTTIKTHDFYGCLRALRVDATDVFAQSYKARSGVTEGCQRGLDGAASFCTAGVCQNGGLCHDNWSSFSCECPVGFTGKTCSDATESFSLGPNSLVTYKQREGYIRDQMAKDRLQRRKKRELNDISQFSMEFRTTNRDGVLFYSEGADAQVAIYVQNQFVHFYSLIDGNPYAISSHKELSDGHWHNITVHTSGSLGSLTVDGVVTQRSLPIGWPPLVSLATESFSLFATPASQSVNGSSIPGFEGCLKRVLMDQSNLPLEGSTQRFDISRHGNVSNSCAAAYHGPLAARGDGPSVHIAVIVIVAFFGVALIVIVIVFVVLRLRRRKPEEKESKKDDGEAPVTANGVASEEAIIRRHIEHELNSHSPHRASALGSRPDLVVADGRSVRESNVVLEPNGFENNGFMDEAPEHYDIDNASSIAPSDLVDVVSHYKQYRRGMLPHDHNNARRSRASPLSMLPPRQSPAPRQSPNPLVYGPYRQSPLTFNNLNTGPPKPISRKSPGLNIDPRGVTSLRSTPLSGLEGLYSPGSNVSSNGSYEQPNIPASRPNSNLRQPISTLGMRSTPTVGLTVDEVNRLNGRGDRESSTSSSSDDAAINQKINSTDFTHEDLHPTHSSSSSSSGDDDAFTCSEMDFESDRHRMQAPALASVREDGNEDAPRPQWDHLLNWGPNFEGLVGVFTDIAQLPDSSLPSRGRVSPRPRSATPQNQKVRSPTPRGAPSPLHVISEDGPYRESGIDSALEQSYENVHEEYV